MISRGRLVAEFWQDWLASRNEFAEAAARSLDDFAHNRRRFRSRWVAPAEAWDAYEAAAAAGGRQRMTNEAVVSFLREYVPERERFQEWLFYKGHPPKRIDHAFDWWNGVMTAAMAQTYAEALGHWLLQTGAAPDEAAKGAEAYHMPLALAARRLIQTFLVGVFRRLGPRQAYASLRDGGATADDVYRFFRRAFGLTTEQGVAVAWEAFERESERRRRHR